MALGLESVKCYLWWCWNLWRIRMGRWSFPWSRSHGGSQLCTGPRKNLQPWPVISLGLPSDTVRTGRENKAEGHPHRDPHPLHSKCVLFSVLPHEEQHMGFQIQAQPSGCSLSSSKNKTWGPILCAVIMLSPWPWASGWGRLKRTCSLIPDSFASGLSFTT